MELRLANYQKFTNIKIYHTRSLKFTKGIDKLTEIVCIDTTAVALITVNEMYTMK